MWIDGEDGTVIRANSMNFQRIFHMGIVTINGEDRLAAFEGFVGDIHLDSHDSLELYMYIDELLRESWK